MFRKKNKTEGEEGEDDGNNIEEPLMGDDDEDNIEEPGPLVNDDNEDNEDEAKLTTIEEDENDTMDIQSILKKNDDGKPQKTKNQKFKLIEKQLSGGK